MYSLYSAVFEISQVGASDRGYRNCSKIYNYSLCCVYFLLYVFLNDNIIVTVNSNHSNLICMLPH